MRKIRVFRVFLAMMIMISSLTLSVSANSANGMMPNRIVFAIDISNSMNNAEVNTAINEFIKIFVDAMYSRNTEIGFVTFTDDIVDVWHVSSIETEYARNEIKAGIDAIRRGGQSDIGLGVHYAIEMLGDTTGYNASVVLISDGQLDLEFSGAGRSVADSLADERWAIEKSLRIEAPIYAIGVNFHGDIDNNYLTRLVENTNGRKHIANDPSEILGLFEDIFFDITGTRVRHREIITTSNEYQSITLDKSIIFSEETNIIIRHSSNSDFTITNFDNVVASSNYSAIKLENFSDESITIDFISNISEEIIINVLDFTYIIPTLVVSEGLSALKIPISARLHNPRTGETLTDSAFYAGLRANLVITNLLTNEIATIPMENTGTEFRLIYNNENPIPATLRVNVFGDFFDTFGTEVEVLFNTTPPIETEELGGVIRRQGRDLKYNLNDYFEHPDGALLSFSLISSSFDLGARIENSTLIITPSIDGNHNVSIFISDARGGSLVAEIVFEVVPFWVYYQSAIITISAIFIIILIIYILFKRRVNSTPSLPPSPILKSNSRFSGARFEGYFLHTLSGNEIPILNWNASYIENKHMISLGEMFNMLDVKEKLPEAHKLFFES
ncbi:MAG: VWA domain-containing protein, partial [Defluviitaleaceae bacterium]|nr:VWA domain-containing protein [Defluviitaleaceae bacterium]